MSKKTSIDTQDKYPRNVQYPLNLRICIHEPTIGIIRDTHQNDPSNQRKKRDSLKRHEYIKQN